MDNRITDLIDFATNGDIDGIKAIIREGIDLDLKNVDGNTALMGASRYSNTTSSLDTVKLLIDSGANLELQDVNGNTALMIAVENSNTTSSLDTVKLLIDSGANLDLQDINGNTALIFAVENSNTTSSLDTVKLLIDSGANLDLQDENGNTALIFAVENLNTTSSLDTVKLLIDSGANLDLQDIDGDTAYIILSRNYTEKIAIEIFYSEFRHRLRVNISKTYNFYDPIMQEGEDIDIEKYIQDDIGNIVIVYSNNKYFFTTRKIIMLQMDDALFYPCKEADTVKPNNILNELELYDLKKIGLHGGYFCNIDVLLNNPDLQTYSLINMKKSYPSFVSKRAIIDENYVSRLHCQAGQESLISFLVSAPPSTRDNPVNPVPLVGGKINKYKDKDNKKTRKGKNKINKTHRNIHKHNKNSNKTRKGKNKISKKSLKNKNYLITRN